MSHPFSRLPKLFRRTERAKPRTEAPREKNGKKAVEFWAIVLLLGTVFIAYSIRIGGLPLLEGRYLLGTDSYRFLRQADIIASDGMLPSVDAMRWVPLGRDLSVSPSLWSYGIAWSHKLLRVFWSQVSTYQVACYSGLVSYLACLVLLYLLWKHLFDASIALLAVNLMAVFPTLALNRTCVGFADRDSFVLLLWVAVVYFYVLAARQTDRQFSGEPDACPIPTRLTWRQGTWALLSGLCAGILALSWQGCGLVTGMVACWVGLKILRGCLDPRDALLYSLWSVCFTSVALSFTGAYQNLLTPYVLLAVVFPGGVLLAGWITLALRRQKNRSAKRNGRLNACPCGIVGILLAGIAGMVLIVSLALLQSVPLESVFSSFLRNLASPFDKSRLMRTVLELRRLPGGSLVREYSIILVAALIGSTLLVSRFFLGERARFTTAILGVQIALCGSIVSLFLPETPAMWVYVVGLTLGGITLTLAYCHRKPLSPATSQSSDQNHLLWLLLWLVITAAASRQAIRFMFYLDPPLMLATSYLLFTLIRGARTGHGLRVTGDLPVSQIAGHGERQPSISTRNQHESMWIAHTIELGILTFLLCSEMLFGLHYALWLGPSRVVPIALLLAGIALIIRFRSAIQHASLSPSGRLGLASITLVVIVLVNIDSISWSFLRKSVNITSEISPIAPKLQEGFTKLTDDTPEDAVIAAQWGFGSMINWLGKRATIIDEDTCFRYWIHLMARHVFAAGSAQEALEFLYTHRASHLLIASLDISELLTVSYTGSDASFDRLACVSLLTHNTTRTVSAQDKVSVFRPLGFYATDTLEYAGTKYPPGQWSIQQVTIIHSESGWAATLHGVAGKRRFSMPPREFRLGDSVVSTEQGAPGCVLLRETFRHSISQREARNYLASGCTCSKKRSLVLH